MVALEQAERMAKIRQSLLRQREVVWQSR